MSAPGIVPLLLFVSPRLRVKGRLSGGLSLHSLVPSRVSLLTYPPTYSLLLRKGNSELLLRGKHSRTDGV